MPLDVLKAEKKVWLFKAPKYLTEHWLKVCETSKTDVRLGDNLLGEELGEIQLPQCLLTLSNPMLLATQEIPTTYDMKQQAEIQCMHLFKETKEGASVDGIVEHKFDLQPVRNTKQGGLTSGVIALSKVAQEESKVPRIQVIGDKKHIRQPLAIASKITRNKQRVQANKQRRLRMSKDELENMLFELFEEQSLWRLQDLLKETDQPHMWLKQVLSDIAMLNTRGEHKDLWELKPEYRTQNMDVDEEQEDQNMKEDKTPPKEDG